MKDKPTDQPTNSPKPKHGHDGSYEGYKSKMKEGGGTKEGVRVEVIEGMICLKSCSILFEQTDALTFKKKSYEVIFPPKLFHKS